MQVEVRAWPVSVCNCYHHDHHQDHHHDHHHDHPHPCHPHHLVSLADGEGGVQELNALLLLAVKLQEDLKVDIVACVGD